MRKVERKSANAVFYSAAGSHHHKNAHPASGGYNLDFCDNGEFSGIVCRDYRAFCKICEGSCGIFYYDLIGHALHILEDAVYSLLIGFGYLLFGESAYIKAKSLISRDTSRRGVRMFEKPLLFERRHFVSYSRGRDLNVEKLLYGFGADRFSGTDILINYRIEYLVCSSFQVHRPLSEASELLSFPKQVD